MFKREAVILAGGLGTRLRDVVDDIPKSMAPVNGRPFLEYLLDNLCTHRISRVIMAVGYMHESIVSHFGNRYRSIDIAYSVEDEPLGTGGAIARAAGLISSETFLVLNGDTLFNVDLEEFSRSFKYGNASLSIALKPMKDFDRYGTVTLDENRILSFNEKGYRSEGLINGGIYVLRKEWLVRNSFAASFSLERDLLERLVRHDLFTGFVSDAYFIDIGIPEDYERAQKELPPEGDHQELQ